jgi:hypothetical protein
MEKIAFDIKAKRLDVEAKQLDVDAKRMASLEAVLTLGADESGNGGAS